MPFKIAAGIGAAGSLAGGLLGMSGAESAAKMEQQALQQALGFQQQVYQQGEQNLQPFINSGQNALTSLNSLLGIGSPGGATSPILAMLGIGPNGATGGGINPATFQGSPGYQFQKQQGQQAVTNSAAANGGLGGNALTALQQQGTQLANQDWYNYLNSAQGGFNNLVSQVGGLAQSGQSAAGTLLGQGNPAAGNVSNLYGGIGSAGAAGAMGSNNALAGLFNGLGQNANLAMLPQMLAAINNSSGGNNMAAANNASASLGPVNSFNPFAASYNYGGMSPSN